MGYRWAVDECEYPVLNDGRGEKEIIRMPYRATSIKPLGWRPRVQASSAKRGLGYQHRKLRAQVLAEEPYCMIRRPGCTGLSETADHIVPRSKGGQTVRENMRGACNHCNIGKLDR